MAHDEIATDLPEFVRLGREPMARFEEFSGKDFWDAGTLGRARGTGGSSTDPYCTRAELMSAGQGALPAGCVARAARTLK